MLIRKAFKFRLEPTEPQREKLAQNAGSCRFVYNKALALQKERLDQTKRLHSFGELCTLLKAWKSEESLLWLKDADSQALQNALKNLDRAFKNAFNKKLEAKFPVFKKRGQQDSFSYPQRFKIENTQIYLPKIGWVEFRKSRQIQGTPKNLTVSRQGNHWFVSIQVEFEQADAPHPSKTHVGIDLGIARFATLSDGRVVKPLNSFKRLQRKLARAQRILSRKRKFSQNWKKQKAKVQQIHTQIANARRDFLHKLSTQISKNHAVVVMEDLKVSNMSASSKGTLENPGKHVNAKSGLNRSILDQGWFEFRRQLEYKQRWRGGNLILVPPQYTSQRCFRCAHTHSDNRKNQGTFLCGSCGYSAHADLNASKNILAVGHTVLASGDIRPLAA